MEEQLNYSHWMTKKKVVQSAAKAGFFLVLFALTLFIRRNPLIVFARVIFLLLAIYYIYMLVHKLRMRQMLSYTGGGAHGKIVDQVLNYLDWDGQGTLLDIGCGSATLTNKAAKKYPQGNMVGVDFWGDDWDYGQEQCETNARIEQVADRVRFQQCDAANLPFDEEQFDAVVSNFVFHEVSTQPDKKALILEALRVLKHGGVFSFQDVFFATNHYPDIDQLVKELAPYVTEIHFEPTRDYDVVPKLLITQSVAGNMGLIHGRK